MNILKYKHAIAVIIVTAMAFTTAAAATRKSLQNETLAIRCSFSESGFGVNNLNDGQSAITSPYWSGYRGRDSFGELEYVEYAWTTKCQITRSTIYWKASGDSIAYPTEAYFMVWDGHGWQRADDVSAPNGAGISTNTNMTIETNRLRLYMRSDVACGIREFSVQGYEGEGCAAATLTPSATEYVIQEGESVTLAADLSLPDGDEEPNWYWLDEQGEVISTEPTLTVSVSNRYTLCYERSCGTVTLVEFLVYVDGVYNPQLGYRWPSYSPTLDYDFRTEYPSLPPPSKGPLPENVNVAKRVNGEWWSVAVGPNANPLITEESMRRLAKKMDEDFAYFRDEMGWPPDKRARNGYYSQVYGYGSGLSFDASTPNTATGGWQSATHYNGSNWPMVLLSYYPIYSFDPSCTYGDRIGQQNACVHEGIHATFADLEGCKNAAWFHEAGNTWLQAEAEVRKSGDEPESMGFLSAGNMIAPFMPIECYSGWLQDDSFGGPAAEGVNMYDGTGQICTWRNLLGGVQYGELFPHVLNAILGKGAVPWIWRYCRSRVLQGMAEGATENGVRIPGLGGKQMRHLIVEYRARQAMIDVGYWSKACEQLLDGNWQLSVKAENNDPSRNWINCPVWRATPYAKMTAIADADSTGWWKPEWRTTPGWSGANQVVLHTSGRAGDKISVLFKEFGMNMVCQLCYRTTTGRIIYGEPISGKSNSDVEVSMIMPEAPANGVVIAVITNTDYIYRGEDTRKAHYNYHLKMGDNVWQPASPNYKWYKWRENIKDSSFNYTGIEEMAKAADATVDKFTMTLAKTVASAGERLWLSLSGVDRLEVPVQICSASGAVVYQQGFLRDGALDIPASLRPGMYVIRAFCGQQQASSKLIIK